MEDAVNRKSLVARWISIASALLAAAPALAKDITVAPTGGDFTTVQAAIDAAPSDATEATRILIAPGTYEQKLTIPASKAKLTLVGQGTKPDDTVLSFHLKASDPRPDGKGNVGTTGSSSVTINGNDFAAENLTFANTAGNKVGQAVAVKTNGDRLIFRNCRFLGFQDTLYPANKGRVLFDRCYISGNTDFIFGNATAVFDHCTINSAGGGFVTAANTTPQQPFGFVFLDCTLTESDSTPAGSVYLGRPWQYDRGSKSAVAYLRCKMGPQINPAGWNPWDSRDTDPGSVTRYSEFDSMDLDGKPLDVSKRVPWSHQLTPDEAAGYTVEKVLSGADGWKPQDTAEK